MPGSPDFRTGNVLATTFTGTLSERHGTPVERIPTPERLMDWFAINDLAVSACSAVELDRARELREAIHLTATAAAAGAALPPSSVHLINDASAHGRAAARLSPDGSLEWELGSPPLVADALCVVAADAVSVIAGERDGRLARCASPTCRAVFLDTSQSRTRRWCDMNTCGNRQKKERFKAKHV